METIKGDRIEERRQSMEQVKEADEFVAFGLIFVILAVAIILIVIFKHITP